MNEPKLKIRILGKAGTGKTTVAQLIKKFLYDKGITNVVYNTHNELQPTEVYSREYLDRNMDALQQKGLEVEIETIQIKRSINI